MKKIAYFAALSTALVSMSASAADLASKKVAPAPVVVASPWDFDIGAGLTSDYMFRGITQSNHAPSVAAHGELRYNFSDMWQGYVGVAGESIKLSKFDGSPSMELDTYGGVRGTFGAFTTTRACPPRPRTTFSRRRSTGSRATSSRAITSPTPSMSAATSSTPRAT